MQLYLNNSGHRWVETNKADNRVVVVYPDGSRHIQQAKYYEALGNFALTAYRYKGKVYRAFAKAYDGSEMRDPDATGINALPHIFHQVK